MNGYTIRIQNGRMSSMVPGLLSGHHTGRIHSRFRSSMNLQFGETLVHVGTEVHGLCCFGLTVDGETMELLLKECQTDSLAVFKQNSLYLYGFRQVIILELDRFLTVDLKIPALTARFYPEDGVQIGTLLLYRELEHQAASFKLGLERDDAFVRYSRVLAGTVEYNDDSDQELVAAVSFFLGRGQGLTPSGDDILTGYGAVLQAFGQAEQLVCKLQQTGLNTTDVSLAYLTAMMDGYANEYFCDIILQIFCKEVLKLRELLCRIEKIGNTSGRDTIYGMYLGFRKIKEAYIV